MGIKRSEVAVAVDLREGIVGAVRLDENKKAEGP